MGNNKIKVEFGIMKIEIESESTEFVKDEIRKFYETVPNVIMNFPVSVCEEKKIELNEIKTLPEGKQLENVEKEYSCLSSFVKEKGFRGDTDLTLGTIYYTQIIEGEGNVSSNDIKEKMQNSRITAPKHISQCFINLRKKGHIQQIDDKEKSMNVFAITEDGIKYVDEYVKKETTKKVSKTRKRTSVQSEIRYNFNTREDINADKYPELRDLSLKEQIMLFLYIMKIEKNIEYLEYNEMIKLINDIYNININYDTLKGTIRKDPKYFHRKASEQNKMRTEVKLLDFGIQFVEKEILEEK